MNERHRIALVGIGKIARDQHVPAIADSAVFSLAATASRNGRIDGIEAFTNLGRLLEARPEISCVSLCTPPHARFADARRALLAGRHVMIEKPPGASVAEVHALAALASDRNLTLFASWHSRHAAGVSHAREWLNGKSVTRVEVVWREDVRHWHPGQDWVWEPGGLGVFDPGINALSILTEIHPRPFRLTKADLAFPANRDTPIAAELEFVDATGIEMSAALDWREERTQIWEIRIVCAEGTLLLSDGGARLSIDGEPVEVGSNREYPSLYARFAELIRERTSDVDVRPLTHVADAFMLGRRYEVEPFNF
ncbi:MAG: Gfo/Idh/MocA family oxidoreductase [Rhizobiaceae bacterium]|nr:Gfo/Idh/MocA family oxidoreductase [Rhizobiaceae bacterium]